MTPDDVRDIFDRALRATRDLGHMAARMDALRRVPMGSGISRAAHGVSSDPTAETGTAIADGDDEMRRMEASCRAAVGEAASLASGIRIGLGVAYGDVLEDHYIRDLGWDAVAMAHGVSRRTVIRHCDVAFDWVASVGLANARAGCQGRAGAG